MCNVIIMDRKNGRTDGGMDRQTVRRTDINESFLTFTRVKKEFLNITSKHTLISHEKNRRRKKNTRNRFIQINMHLLILFKFF